MRGEDEVFESNFGELLELQLFFCLPICFVKVEKPFLEYFLDIVGDALKTYWKHTTWAPHPTYTG
jgi:hypothetical protein